MPTYEYQCERCGHRFERFQAMSDRPVAECPECRGSVQRLVSGGAGFFVKGSGGGGVSEISRVDGVTRCGRKQTCCGRETPCEKPDCE